MALHLAEDASLCITSAGLRTVTQVTLPNGLGYTFLYADSTAPWAEIAQGEIRQMTLPQQAGVDAAFTYYKWTHNNYYATQYSPIPWNVANTNPLQTKSLTAPQESDAAPVDITQTWNYSFSTLESWITGPDGGVTDSRISPPPYQTWSTGLVYKVTSPAGTSWRCWQQSFVSPYPSQDSYANSFVRAEYHSLPGATQAAATWFDYDKNGNLTSKQEYDWVSLPTTDVPSCTVSGTVIRDTENHYWNPAGGAGSPAHAADTPTTNMTNAYWAAGANQKRDSLLESRTYIGPATGGATAAVAQYNYDNPNTTGNVTPEYHWDNQLGGAPTVATTAVTLNSGNAAMTTRTFGTNGLLLSEADPSGNQTSYTYGQVQTRPGGSSCPSNFVNLYPTSIGSPVNQVHQYYWDCATGVLNDDVFQSNQSVHTRYGYDGYGRVTSETDGYGLSSANQRTTTTAYDDNYRQVTVTQDGLYAHIYQYDELGQQFLDRQNTDSAAGPITASSTSDLRTVTMRQTVPGVGQYVLTSNPYQSDGPSNEPTLGWTLQYFDQTGRLANVSYYGGQGKPAPFGSNPSQTAQETYTYSGSTTTVTDPQSHTRSTAADALGRLVSASEGTLSSATYTYDTLDNLHSVSQSDTTTYGSTESQVRNFIYSSLGRLVSASNPEADNATTYTYYPDGALHTKTDARGATTTYTVDGADRVLTKDYTDGTTPGVRYCYDGNHLQYSGSSWSCVATSGRSDYAQGALTDSAAVSGGAIASETQYTNIDALGRVTASQQTTAGMGSSQQFAYTYGPGSFLSAVQYPSGRWVSYDPTGANRVRDVRDGLSGTNYYAQALQYKPNGSMAQAAMAGSQWIETRGYNSRLQPWTMQIQQGTQTPLALQWGYTTGHDSSCNDSGTTNNGNVTCEELQYPSGGTQQSVLRNYGYDGANRITSYAEPTAGKSQSFGYDGFGNMWQSGTAAGVPGLRTTGSSQYLMANGTVRNRLSGVTYDAAGNQTQLQPENGMTAAYDGENRMSQVLVNGVVIASYGYDGEGRRVSRSLSSGTTYYVYDADGELMVEYDPPSLATTPGTQYVVTDQLGSTRMLLTGQGVCQTQLDYAPFGGQVMRSGQNCYATSPVVGMPLFTGQVRDGETADASGTGMDYFGVRYHWGALGRFTSADEPLADQMRRIRRAGIYMPTFGIIRCGSWTTTDGSA